jgi:hypothetical protein
VSASESSIRTCCLCNGVDRPSNDFEDPELEEMDGERDGVEEVEAVEL